MSDAPPSDGAEWKEWVNAQIRAIGRDLVDVRDHGQQMVSQVAAIKKELDGKAELLAQVAETNTAHSQGPQICRINLQKQRWSSKRMPSDCKRPAIECRQMEVNSLMPW